MNGLSLNKPSDYLSKKTCLSPQVRPHQPDPRRLRTTQSGKGWGGHQPGACASGVV